jgi:hypothetical protein
MYCFVFYTDNLMKPHGSIWVVRIMCDMRTNRFLRCFNNLEGLSCGDLLVDVVPELANGLRVGTTVPCQDLSGA